jgi:hypothetical protein
VLISWYWFEKIMLTRENFLISDKIRRGWRKCGNFPPVLYFEISIITKISWSKFWRHASWRLSLLKQILNILFLLISCGWLYSVKCDFNYYFFKRDVIEAEEIKCFLKDALPATIIFWHYVMLLISNSKLHIALFKRRFPRFLFV